MRLRPLALLASLAAALTSPGVGGAQAVATTRAVPARVRIIAVDLHMARARDLRHAGRNAEALAALDTVMQADANATGVHPMRALVLADMRDWASAREELRRAHAAGDRHAFQTALYLGNAQYRTASLSRVPTEFTSALATLQLADSIATDAESHSIARVLVAATALSLANQELPQGPAQPTCADLSVADARLQVARASLSRAERAPAAQVTQIGGVLEQLASYTSAHARRLRCA